MSDITQNVVMQFLNQATKDLSSRSYNSYREILNTVFGKVWRDMGMDCNPVDGVQTRKMVTRSRKEFTAEQVDQIIKSFDTGFFYDSIAGGPEHKDGTPPKPVTMEYRPEFLEEYRVVVLLAIYTGCRLMDACLLRWPSVSLDEGCLEYTPHKTAHSSGKVVRLPLHPALRSALANAMSWRTDEYVCPNVAARYLRNNTGVSKTIQKLISCATGLKVTADNEGSRARGASQYGMHSFRHTFVSFCANAGVPLAVVADIVGHGNPAMTERYFHASAEVKAQAVEAINFQPLPPGGQSARDELRNWIETASDEKIELILGIVKSH